MAGFFDFGDTEDDKRENIGLLGLIAGGQMMAANQPGATMGQVLGHGATSFGQGLLQMQQQKAMQDYRKTMLAQGQARMVPNSVREYEYAKQNGFEGSFEDYRNQVMGRNEVPSNVREWQYFDALPQDKQAKYLTMRRGMNPINLGDQYVIPNQAVPGQSLGAFPKGIPPEQQPELKGQQALESGRGTAQATREGTAETKGVNAKTTLSMLDGVDDLIDKSTGSYGGAARDTVLGAVGISTDAGEANAKLKVMQASLMTTMPRMEGPQSDRDVQLYREAAGQIGDPTVPAGKKKAAVQMIRTLQQKYKDAAPSARGASGGWSIQRVD